MEPRQQWLSALYDTYFQQNPGTRTPSEILELFHTMQRRKGPFTVHTREFGSIGPVIEEMEQGILPTPEKLVQIDATVCWMNTYWTVVQQVADHLVASKVIPRHYFSLPDKAHEMGFFSCYRSNLKAVAKYGLLGEYFRKHCMLFLYHRDSPSKDIVVLPFYCRPLWWLAEGVVFGKVPRERLEEALAAVPAIGFMKECEEMWDDWYTYQKWIPWHRKMRNFVGRYISSPICGHNGVEESEETSNGNEAAGRAIQ